MSDVTRVSLNRELVYGTVRGSFMSRVTYLDVLLSSAIDVPQATCFDQTLQLCFMLLSCQHCRCECNILFFYVHGTVHR